MSLYVDVVLVVEEVVVVGGVVLHRAAHTTLDSTPLLASQQNQDGASKEGKMRPLANASLTPSLPAHPHIHSRGSTAAAAMVNSNEIA